MEPFSKTISIPLSSLFLRSLISAVKFLIENCFVKLIEALEIFPKKP